MDSGSAQRINLSFEQRFPPALWARLRSGSGSDRNRHALGTQVTIFAGGHKWTQEVRSGSTYLSSSDFRLHFGLGSAAAVDHIDVLWPSGLNERFPGCTADRFVNLVEALGSALPLYQ